MWSLFSLSFYCLEGANHDGLRVVGVLAEDHSFLIHVYIVMQYKENSPKSQR